MKQLASNIIDSLRDHPLALVLLLVNIIGLAGFGFTLHEIGNAIARKDAMLQSCIDKR
ncbi:hypothetical protein [Bradyrhizobium sp. DASA03120]|uniref:hypothetical protein n=1 Tax=Bradyrhizobium sp. SMVTL-02 TaxID=3395917 RepID=UPI003F6F1B36